MILERLCTVALLGGLATSAMAAPPTVILFVSDDHGYADSGAYGDTVVRTPNIDRLAESGMRFTHAFAASPLCSPSRCVIATGLMPHRNGGHKFGTPIRKGLKTMAHYFRELGYFTAHFGKFHHAPRKQFPYDHVHRSEEAAAAFLKGYAGEKPLLLVVCTHPPHTPWVENKDYDPARIELPPNFVDTPETRTDRAKYYSDVTLMDTTLGDVLDAASAENTLFLYTSDQGANWPFAKWCVYDGGLRVPLIVRWPGRVEAGGLSDAMISLADLLPTMLDAAGEKIPGNVDGRSFLKVLSGSDKKHRDVVFGSHTGNENGGPGIANHCPARTVRTPDYRYILNLKPERRFDTHITGCKSGPHHLPFWNSWVEKAKTDSRAARIVKAYQHRAGEELYDLRADPHEMVNLAALPEHGERLTGLRKQLTEWRVQQGERLPGQGASNEK
jgi:N-sulfoglucosamine sulfohydrolase